MKKVLFAANLDSFLVKFLIPQLKYFKENGYEVHIASKNENIEIPYCDKKYDVSFSRSFNIKDIIKSYRQMRKILKNEQYELISCHTPIGGAVTRLAAKNVKNTKIVYTAHGFHFFTGSSKKNWLLFYPIEKKLSKYTSSIITINEEDYVLAKEKMHCNIEYVPGIGIDNKKFNIKLEPNERKKIMKELNVTEDNFIMIFSAEICGNKNQKLLIDTLNILKTSIPKVVLLLAGNDLTNGELEEYAKKIGVSESVRFLGFRKDIPKLLCISNIAVSSSKREGLPLNIIEAMYMGLPVVATNCRGNRNLIKNQKNGFLVYSFSPAEFAEKIIKIYEDKKLYERISKNNKNDSKRYTIENVLTKILNIYKKSKCRKTNYKENI